MAVIYKVFKRVLVLVACVGFALPSLAQETPWELKPSRYKRMNLFERAQYDKACRLLKDGSYRPAASEFQKQKVQFPDSEVLPHVLFMRGYSLYMAKDRNEAIKVFNELLDFFGDVIEDAAPALYYLGLAHLANGDTREGLEAMQEVVEDEDYKKHPVAAGALRRLADNKWRNKQYDDAIRYWKQVVAEFSDVNKKEADAARTKVADYYIKSRDFAAYEEWLINEDQSANAGHRRWVCELAWQRAWYGFQSSWDGKYNNFNREEKKADMRAFYEWFMPQKEWYAKAEDEWRFYHNCIYFASQRLHDSAETMKAIEAALPLIQKMELEKDRNNTFAWICDRMCEARDWTACEYCINKITDQLHATYKRYGMHSRKGEWKKALAQLDLLEKANDQYWTPRALGEHARVLKDVLHQYGEAIELYRKINNPPNNLWSIQDCFKRWGKLSDAITTLNEIENSFPNDAARAAWTKAYYYHEAGQAENAIAGARRVLKMYPKSPESSHAHQLLEGYGIATGGGVIDEE